MKTHIIQLDKNDDTISVREKMAWSHTGRILLILPADGHILSSKLELNLVKRHADELDGRVALITKNADTRFFARQLGIPVFKDLRSAQESNWKNGNPLNKWDNVRKHPAEIEALRTLAHPKRTGVVEHPLTRLISFSVVMLALLALGVLILPEAEITLHPHVELQSITIPVTADTNASTANLSTGTLPAEIRQVVVEGRKQMAVTGRALIPDHFAIGALLFTNISDHIITIPVGTIVSTLGNKPVKFLTTQDRDVSLDPGESAVISTRGVVPGTSGNLPPDSVVAVEGDLGLNAMVTNPYATHGGTDAYLPAPTESDLRLLYEDLNAELQQAARFELESTLFDEAHLIQPSLELVEIMEQKMMPVVGEPGRELALTLRLRYQAQVVTGEMMRNLTKPILDANIKDGYSPLDGTIHFTQASSPTFGADSKAYWSLKAERKLQISIDVNHAISQIKGQSISTAQDSLNQFMELDEQPLIIITPAWWKRMPFLPMRIHLIMGVSG